MRRCGGFEAHTVSVRVKFGLGGFGKKVEGIGHLRFEVLRVVPSTEGLQGLLDLARPRERGTRQHPHNTLLPDARFRIVSFDLHAQIPKLLEGGIPCVCSNEACECSDGFEGEVFGICGHKGFCCVWRAECDVRAGLVDEGGDVV